VQGTLSPGERLVWAIGLDGNVSRTSWFLVVLGLVAASIAVQFDEPWLEISGATAFVLLFAFVVVALRGHVGAAKAELMRSESPPRRNSSTSDDAGSRPARQP
jgi:hypothetical protein